MVCAAFFGFAALASAQAKVGIISLQRAVFESAEIKKADAQMQATFKPRQDRIEALNKEIAALAQQLQSSNGKLSPAAEADLQNQGSRKQREVQRLTDDVNADAQAYRNEILSKSSDKMQAVVKKLAEEKGLDLVIDASTALYFKDAMDITKDAIAAYDKAYPAK
jgi:outer membrane protein